MQLFVCSNLGPTLCLQLAAPRLGDDGKGGRGGQRDGCGCTVRDLRVLVSQRLGIPPDAHRLMHAGRLLGGEPVDEDASLGACGISDDSTIRVLLRLPGGGGEAAAAEPSAMGIHVKVLGGRCVAISVPTPQESTVAHVQELLRQKEGLETDKYELMFRGERLLPDRTLQSYQIGADATLEAVLPGIRIPPKGRCAVPDCCDRVARIVGECRYCGMGYCSRHRLPESHECDNIQGCRQQSYEKNSSKLMDEKCVADKV